MPTFEVIVETTVEEIWYVEAADDTEAADNWSDGVLDRSECVEITRVEVIGEVEDEDVF